MKNRVTKRMFRKMVSTTAAAAILGVSLCACGAGPADTAAEEAAPVEAAEAESGQGTEDGRSRGGSDRGKHSLRRRNRSGGAGTASVQHPLFQ